MKRFTYFQEWSEELIEECTRLSKLKFFESNDIIYGKINNLKYFKVKIDNFLFSQQVKILTKTVTFISYWKVHVI